MASSLRETIAQLKANKKNRTYEELKQILEDFGFQMHPRQGGSHRVFNKRGCFISPSIPEKSPVLPCYVGKVIAALEECCDE
jgi:hypothetical protein